MSNPYPPAPQQPGQEPGTSRTPEPEPAVGPPPVPDRISPDGRDEPRQASSDTAASERLFSDEAGHSSRNPDATEVFRDQDLTAPPPVAAARQGSADQPTMEMPADRPHPSPEPDQSGRTAAPTAYPPTYTPGQRDTQQARPAYESGLATPAHGQPIFEQDQPVYGPGQRTYEPPRQPEFQPAMPGYGQPGSDRPGYDQPTYPDDQSGTQAGSQLSPTPGGPANPVPELPLPSRARPSLIAGGLGLLLSLVGLYLVARYGSAAVTEFQAGTRSSNFVLATIGGLLLLAVLVLSGWSFLASLIPGLILTGLGVWALVSSSGSTRIGNAIGRLVSGFNSVNWHVLALTLVPGIVLLAVSVAGLLGRSGGKRFGRLIADRANAKRRATDGTSLDR